MHVLQDRRSEAARLASPGRHPGAGAPAREGKDSDMTFALTLVLVLVLSSAYLVHQYYSDDLHEAQ
jgi:hypothetical protein